jgi:predicted transcriptional regulator
VAKGSKPRSLTDAELRLMEVLWRIGQGTVADVTEGVPKSTPLAYSTVLTTLRILETKGFVRHTKEGRAFVYRPLVGRDQAQDHAVVHLLKRFFDGSPEGLMLSLLERKKIKPDELKRLRKRIEEAEEGV